VAVVEAGLRWVELPVVEDETVRVKWTLSIFPGSTTISNPCMLSFGWGTPELGGLVMLLLVDIGRITNVLGCCMGPSPTTTVCEHKAVGRCSSVHGVHGACCVCIARQS
jgi:hypothetical protein